MGACVQCSNKNCYQAFHVSCARKAQLYLRMKSPNGTSIDIPSLKGFCHKHVPTEWCKERKVDTAIVEALEYYRRTMKGRRWADSQASALAITGPNQSGYLEEEVEQEENAANAATNKRKRLALQKKIWRLPSGAPVIPHAVY